MISVAKTSVIFMVGSFFINYLNLQNTSFLWYPLAMYMSAKFQAKKHTYSGKIQFFDDKLLFLKEENVVEKEILWENIKLFSDKKRFSY
jgi:hypothetical protein